MDGIQKNVTGVTIHLEPMEDGRVRYIFAVDGQIRQEETLTKAELRSRFPAIGLQILGHLGGDDAISEGVRKLGQVLAVLGGRVTPGSRRR